MKPLFSEQYYKDHWDEFLKRVPGEDYINLEADLDRELAERLAELDFIDEQKAQIANPDMLGQVVLNTVWDQFTNQVAIQAGEDFVKSNNGLRLDLSDDAHIIDPDKFEKGQLPEHNFENQAKYKKRIVI